MQKPRLRYIYWLAMRSQAGSKHAVVIMVASFTEAMIIDLKMISYAQ
jgi:hypothetical protein